MDNILGVYCKEYPIKSYLYDIDMNTFSKLKNVIDNIYKIFITEKGVEFIKNNFLLISIVSATLMVVLSFLCPRTEETAPLSIRLLFLLMIIMEISKMNGL